MINQLRYVTRKLQGQTLNEAPENGGKVGSEDRDSGTESDDEQPYDDPEPGIPNLTSLIGSRGHDLSQKMTDIALLLALALVLGLFFRAMGRNVF